MEKCMWKILPFLSVVNDIETSATTISNDLAVIIFIFNTNLISILTWVES